MIPAPTDDRFQFDYRRHLAAQDLLPQHQEDFQRLVKLLRHATRFQLLFARIADESYRGLLIGKLQDLLATAGRPVHTADLADDARFPSFEALETWLATLGQGQAVIHLVNTGHWLQGPRVQSLNLRRDALAKRLDAALLWWLPPAALERVAREAPDAWSWRAGVFDFVAAVSAQRTGLASRPEASSDISPLTLAQRSRRLAVLHQQLNGEGAAAIPDDLRLNLLIEQGDLYKSLGQWDLAQRVLREGALPLAERMGDERAKAVTQGRIADILQARGELDAALSLHDQRLPVAQQMSDIDSIAHIRYAMARIRLQRGDQETGGFQQIHDDLAESFDLWRKLGRPDGIGAAGELLAQVLAMRGQQGEALEVLDQAESCYVRLANDQGIARLRSLREKIAAGS